MTIRKFIEHAGYYFNLMPDKEEEQAIIAQITEGVSFRGANLWVLIFAIFIASLGLNTATVYFLLTPLSEARSELLARTSPTLYDVLIAFCGGAAGIIALCTRGKGNVIPGVAIATALMPPLCTAGFGLATGHLLYFLEAFYLFFINTVFIALFALFPRSILPVFHQHRVYCPCHLLRCTADEFPEA